MSINLKKTIVASLLLGVRMASAQNLLPNGDFSDAHQISGWTSVSGDATISFSTNDAESSPTSGSLELTASGSGLVTSTSSCFAVRGGYAFTYGGKYASTWAANPGSYGQASFQCTTFATTDCSAAGTDFAPTTASIDYSAPFLSFTNVTAGLPTDAMSAQCRVTSQITAIGENGLPPLVVDFDDLSFVTSASTLLGGFMSGNWYDVNNGGEGFQLEFTAQQNTLLAIWFTFSADGSGKPIWIYAQGPYDARTSSVTVPAFYSHGASFPPAFQAGDVTREAWGTFTFTFSDCNHGTASWAPTVSGYSAGSMSIGRLTSIAGTSCP